jgi:hypothetical protein
LVTLSQYIQEIVATQALSDKLLGCVSFSNVDIVLIKRNVFTRSFEDTFMMTLMTMTRAITASHEKARQHRGIGSIHEADLIDETLLGVIQSLVNNLQADSAWARAIRVLVNLVDLLPIDAFTWREYSLTTTRIDAILFLSDLTALEKPEDVRELISAAITLGAPTYNAGGARECAMIYWVNALTLALAPVTRGFSGQTRMIKLLRQAVDEPVVNIARNRQATEDFAWRMRHTLDDVLKITG